jgi:multiple sugar transport system permease protein
VRSELQHDPQQTFGVEPDFLSAEHVLWSIANIVVWTYAGYNMIIMLAALQAIPADIIEAASIDGAGPVRLALRIKIPLIAPALVLTGVFSIIGTLQLFTEPAVMRTISTAITSTYTPTMAAYSAASSNDYSYAAALSVLIATVSFVLSFGFLRLTYRWTRS